MMMPPMGFPVLAACLVIGAVAAIYFSRRRAYNNYHENHDDNQNESNLGRPSNLTCPFCGNNVVANDYPLICGHLCHVTCFRARPGSLRNRCTFCYNDQDDDEVVPRVSTSRVHEEVRQRLNRQTSSNVDENNVTAASSSESMPAVPPTVEEVNCAFCCVRLEAPTNDKQLSCGHYAHDKCFEKFRHLVKCQTCFNSSDSEDDVESPSHLATNN